MPLEVTVKLIKLTICPCGYAVLDDSIKIGTEYKINPETIEGGYVYYCGRCKAVHKDVVVVLANQLLHPELPPAPLPLTLFDYKE